MSVALDSAHPPKPKHRRAALRIIGLIALIWIGLLARDAISLKFDWDALQHDSAVLSDANAKLDFTALQAHVASAHFDLQALRAHAAPFMIIAPLLSWVPKYGGDIQAAPALLNMAVELSAAGDYALSTLAPIWPPKADGNRSAIEQIAQSLSEHQADLQAIRLNIDRVGTFRSMIDTSRLSDRVKSLLDKFDEVYPAARSGAGLLSIAPQLIGSDRPHTYLLLIQNEDELRPSGGFISAAARITLSAGKIISLTVIDGNLVDDYLHKPYGDPPEPLYTVMGSELWLFRDANWSPDFPTAAREAAYLFDYGQGGGPFDGVIAINQRVVQAIVAAIEPVPIDDTTPALTTQNLEKYLREAWGPQNYGVAAQRKNFIAKMSQAIIQRLLKSPEAVRWPSLARGLLDRLNSHDLLIVLTDPALDQSALSDWNGSLQKSSGDYLMLVDANLGFNKVNAILTQTLNYAATIQPDRSIQSNLTIGYWNNNPPQAGCEHQPNYDMTITYEFLIDRCYYDYLRVLTPDGAQLIDSTPHPVPAANVVTGIATDGSISTTHELDKTSFATFFVVERGAALHMAIRYSLPNTLITRDGNQWVYHLIWQKEPGAAAAPIEFTLSWPSNWKFVSSSLQPKSISAQSITIDQTLSADLDIEVRLSDQP
jgi:Protein of unknown function (DUF4012)